jgi:hypothetical protein
MRLTTKLFLDSAAGAEPTHFNTLTKKLGQNLKIQQQKIVFKHN